MAQPQNAILKDVPSLSRHLFFSLLPSSNPEPALNALAQQVSCENNVIGIGQSLLNCLGKEVSGMRDFPVLSGPGIAIPSTPNALWCWLRGDDRGELLHRSRHIEQILAESFQLDEATDCFMYDESRDLSGYIDGTENPEDDEALSAATLRHNNSSLDGSSFVAVQQWLHDLDAFQSLTEAQQDDIFGRHHSNNEEFDEAPESAHVKRTAQESFEPEAFMLRRSMPWAEGMDAGLMFVAFGHSFDAYEAILNRMIGTEDGITDGLFTFSRPLTGAYFWCPPTTADGTLNLDAIR